MTQASAFDHIIVPLDLVAPCDEVLRFTSVLAPRAGVDVRLVEVASPGLDHSYDRSELLAYASKIDTAFTMAEILESNDVVPALQAEAGAHGLIAIETRARRALAATLMGSTTNELLRAAKTPVLLVGPGTETPSTIELMQVCIDTPDAAGALVPVACAWARQLQLKVRFVHALADDASASSAALDLVEDAVRHASEEFGVDATCAVISGRHVADAIVDDAAASGAAIIAVGMRPRSRALRLALGSEAMAVTQVARAGVLAVPVAQTFEKGNSHG